MFFESGATVRRNAVHAEIWAHKPPKGQHPDRDGL